MAKNIYLSLITWVALAGEGLSYGKTDRPESISWSTKIEIEAQENTGWTLLHDAAYKGDLKQVKTIIKENKIAIDQKDIYGQTPLWWAAQNGKVEVITFLADHGASVNDADEWGRRPIQVTEDAKAFKALLDKGASLDIRDKSGNTLLHSLAEGFNTLNAETERLEKAKTEIARTLLQTKEVLVNSVNESGQTPLDIAMGRSGNKLIIPILKEYAEENKR
jgi:ankyrin repeat protein